LQKPSAESKLFDWLHCHLKIEIPAAADVVIATMQPHAMNGGVKTYIVLRAKEHQLEGLFRRVWFF
tara:strand:- start:605 stop:802 length:198 start_codon:yes stop_codon:yes gene_type:complete